jgi:2-methylisocitrate lyase-like PEP mutase family enzyme
MTMADAATLRTRLAHKPIVVAPGVYDALTAHLAERAGFSTLYVSGAAIAYTRLGRPDIGLVAMNEVADIISMISDRVRADLIVDADTGYGNALNVSRTMRLFERAGARAIQLEDQAFPKRCGHLDDKTVVPAAEMIQKLRAARDAASDADLVLIARTDAIAVEGLEAAIERALAYAEAGADVIFVEAPTSEAQMETIARRVSTPKLLNMFEGGKTPLVPLDRLGALGYRIVIIPSDLQRAAIRAMQDVLTAIRRDGNSRALADRMATFTEREAIVGTADYLTRDREDSR